MINWKISFIVLLLFSACKNLQEVDLIVHNATIYTLNDSSPKAEAMAIKNGKIVAIGPENEILNKYTSADILDISKMPVYPGFIDAHCHFMGYGLYLNVLNLKETNSFAEVIEKVKEFAKSNSSEWIIGRGWDQNDWKEKKYPTKHILDSLFPNRPIYLKRVDGHAALLNSKALELAGITALTKIEGGEVISENGNLNGIITDNVMNIVEQIIPKKTKEEKKKALLAAQLNCFAVGLTTVDDAGLDYEDVMLIKELHHSGELKMKIYAMLNPTLENEELAEKGIIKTNKLTVRSFKLYADGSLGSRGALLKNYYQDAQNHRGVLVDSLEKLKHFAKLCYALNFQLNTHSIGDSANALIFSIYAEKLKKTNDFRWRIEHAQVVDKTDLHFFSDYTIIPSVQPTHATSDMYWAGERLGKEREASAYAYNELLKQNQIIVLGTDFPVEDINPIYTFFAAVFRKDHNNYPTNGYQIENALSRENALKGMTIWAAISNFEENEKGSLEVGKDADFIILNQDILNVAEENMLKTKTIYTFINGEKVFGK